MHLPTTKCHNRDGSTVTYYQLAENFYNKTKKASQTQVIYNFGRAEQLDLDVLRRLIHSIQRILTTQDASTYDRPPLSDADLEFDQVFDLGTV